MAQGKNLGKTLYLSQFGGERPIPPEFLAAMNRREEVTSVPNFEELPKLSDEIVESRLVTDRTGEQELHVIKKDSGNIVLLDFRTNDQGQAIQVTSTLLPTGTTPPPPSATSNVAFKDLGNGWTIQEVAVEGSWIGGVFVPGVFSGNLFSKEVPNVTPEEFRATTPDVTTRTDSAGIAVLPTLDGDELHETQEQITATKKRITITTEAIQAVPKVLDKGRDTNQNKQDVIVTKTLVLDSTTAPVATALKDVSVKQLGSGQKVIEERDVTAVFGANVFERSRPNLIPEEFRPSIPDVTTQVESAGNAADPTLSGAEIVETQTQVNAQVKRVRITTQAAPSLPVALTFGRDTNAAKQDVTVTRTLMTNITAADTATATKDVQVKELGDGNKVQETRVVSSVFSNDVFTRSRPNLIPEEFRPAIPTVSVSTESAGAAVDPTLSGTELEERQSQITALTRRIEITTQAAPSLPVTLDKGRDTNNDKQDVVVTRTLLADGTSAETATALKDVQVKQLGDGNKVQETRVISAVATHNLFRRERPNLVPEKFRPSIPTVVTRQDTSGTAVDPTLSGTELSESQEQVNELVKRITLETQAAPSLPISLTGKKTNADRQDVVVVETLQSGISSQPSTTALIDVEVTPLGDGNVVVRTETRPSVLDKTVFEAKVPEFIPERFRQTSDVETTTIHEDIGTAAAPTLNVVSGDLIKREEQVNTSVRRRTTINRPNSGFPSLDGHRYDPELDILVSYNESIQTAGANASTAHTEVEPLNDNLDLVRTTGFTALQAALDAYSKVFVGTTNIDFPAQLNSVAGLLESVQGTTGVYNQSGGWGIAGNGSASMTLHGSANGGAGIMPDVIPDIQQTWGANVPCTHTLVFVASSTPRSTILSRLSSLMTTYLGGATTVNDWPIFVPKSVTVVCHGEHVTGQASVDLHRTSVAQFDYNGDNSGITGEASTTGFGQSYDVAITVKTVRIPPTIHSGISITSPSGATTFGASAIINAGSGGNTGVITVSGQANGNISVGTGGLITIPATPGTALVPNSGYYLYRLVSEPHNKGDRIRVHAEIVHFDGNRSVVP